MICKHSYVGPTQRYLVAEVELPESHQTAIRFVLESSKRHSDASKVQKTRWERWRKISLWLVVFGSFLATLGGAMATEGAAKGSTDWGQVFAAIGGVLLAAVGSISTYMLSPSKSQAWVRLRAVAESLKSNSYRFAAVTPPFDGEDAPEQLINLAREQQKAVDVSPIGEVDKKKLDERLPAIPIAPNDYIQARVDNQISWYRDRAGKFRNLHNKWRWRSFGFALLGAAAGALHPYLGLASWVALSGTITGAIGSFLHAGRFDFLILTYSGTATELEGLKALYQSNQAKETAGAFKKFVQDCEDVMSREHKAWLAEWTRDKTDGKDPGADEPVGDDNDNTDA